MEIAVAVLSDLIMLVFNLLLYVKLTPLKKDTPLVRGIIYCVIVGLTVLYMVCAYVLKVPYAAAAFLCMSIPSFVLFYSLCKYKSSRFLVTFCFIDTVTFIIAAFAKIVQLFSSSTGGILSCIVMLVLSVGTYLLLRPYCSAYRQLLEQVSKGWAPMAVSTVFIYLLLVAASAYPKPMLQRPEYIPLYLFLCITILSFYWVFIVLLTQKAKLSKANALLKQQQHWHDLAYLDALTGLANPAAFASRAHELESLMEREETYFLLFDIDDFKRVNDTYGHLTGNEVLKNTAALFLRTFSGRNYEFFRVGGDEFAAIVLGLSEQQVRQAAEKINTIRLDQEPSCTYSCGWAGVDYSQENAFEKALAQADQAMYAVKNQKKHSK